MKAFPYMQQRPDGVVVDCNYGMDLRDYFAAKAMQPLIQDYLKDMNWETDNPYTCFAMASQVAYKIADQMIEAREQ